VFRRETVTSLCLWTTLLFSVLSHLNHFIKCVSTLSFKRWHSLPAALYKITAFYMEFLLIVVWPRFEINCCSYLKKLT
jgi:hypothetical protein